LYFTESKWEDQSAFDYDYETLRTTGVILAVVMFVLGILIALSKLTLRHPTEEAIPPFLHFIMSRSSVHW
uniref:FXYD domain-containing ion transport regulator n=1 Tax=Electrophorus electricus TaxID=8005 RepID=A0A4W4GI91_ELEEL